MAEEKSSSKLSLQNTNISVGSDLSSSTTQKLSSAKLPVLKSPGPESNYLDWEIVITSYFEAAGLDYIIEQPKPESVTPTWSSDNKVVCAILTQAIDSSNLRYIREFRRDAHGMWNALLKAHQDQTTGGRVYWL